MGWLGTRPTMGLDRSKFKKNKERIDLTRPSKKPWSIRNKTLVQNPLTFFWNFFGSKWGCLYSFIYIYIYMIFFRSTHVDPPDTWLRSYHRSTLKLSFKIIIIIIFIYTLTWINMSLPFRSTIRALPWIGPWFKF